MVQPSLKEAKSKVRLLTAALSSQGLRDGDSTASGQLCSCVFTIRLVTFPTIWTILSSSLQRVHLLDLIQYFSVFLSLGKQKLAMVLQVWSHMCWTEGSRPFPLPVGCSGVNTAQSLCLCSPQGQTANACELLTCELHFSAELFLHQWMSSWGYFLSCTGFFLSCCWFIATELLEVPVRHLL